MLSGDTGLRQVAEDAGVFLQQLQVVHTEVATGIVEVMRRHDAHHVRTDVMLKAQIVTNLVRENNGIVIEAVGVMFHHDMAVIVAGESALRSIVFSGEPDNNVSSAVIQQEQVGVQANDSLRRRPRLPRADVRRLQPYTPGRKHLLRLITNLESLLHVRAAKSLLPLFVHV